MERKKFPQKTFLMAAFRGLLLTAVLVLAGYLRFFNLRTNPGWYGDEGTLVEIAANLLEGRVEYYSLGRSTLLAARLPLFPVLLAGLMSLFGKGITTLRYFTAGLAVASVFFLYWTVRRMLGKEGQWMALTAALLLAIYPGAVFYSRIGFSYNLLPLIVIGLMGLLWEYLETDNKTYLLVSGLLLGIGTFSDVVMFAFLPVLFLVGAVKNWKWAFQSILTALVPLGIYAGLNLLLIPDVFLYDAQYTFFRLGELPLIIQYPFAVYNLTELISSDVWWAFAVIGLFMIKNRRLRYLSFLMFTIPLFLLARTAYLPGLSFYYLIPLFPVVALGAACLLTRGTPVVIETIQRGVESMIQLIGLRNLENDLFKTLRKWAVPLSVSLIGFPVLFGPFVIPAVEGVVSVRSGFDSSLEPILVDPESALEAVNFVNQRTASDDLVITSPTIGWALDSRVVGFQLAMAYRGEATKHFPDDLPKDRFVHPADYRQASFALVDPMWKNWGLPNLEGLQAMTAQVGSWELVLDNDQIQVYQNPDRGE